MIRTLSNRKYPRFRFYTDVEIQGRPLIVEAHPLSVTLRQRYSQRKVRITWEEVFNLALKQTLSGNGNGENNRAPGFLRGKRYV